MMFTPDQRMPKRLRAFADVRQFSDECTEITNNFAERKVQILPYFNEVALVSATRIRNSFFGQISWT